MTELERSLEMFAIFLEGFKKNPKQYRKVNIRIDFVGKVMFVKHSYNFIDYEGDEIIEHSNKIWDVMTSLLIGCDIVCSDDNDSVISFCFRNGNDMNNRKFIYVLCFKE